MGIVRMKMKLAYTSSSHALIVAHCFLASYTADAFVPSHTSSSVTTSITKFGSTATKDEVVVEVATIDTALDEVEQQKPINNIVDTKSSSSSSPGLDENKLFNCDDSVEYWRNFQIDGFWSAQQNLAEMASISRRFVTLSDSDAISYWFKHVGRSSYFFGNAALGSLASGLHERFVANDNNNNNEEEGITTNNSNNNGILPFNINSSIATRLLLEAFTCYEQDYNQISNGAYTQPWDMESLSHRQSSPINVLTQTGRFVNEAIGTLARWNRMTEDDKKIWITDDASPSLYPDYYRTAFHYQTDGWMSQRSANVYETSTETLFLGRQDAMQRTSLGPIVEYSKSRADIDVPTTPLKVLEVACGTGRFMTFIRDNLPLDTECTAVDLSPFYLDLARDNDAYWRKTRRESEIRIGNNLNKDDIQPLRLIQANAEDLPFINESYDVVVCVYLYHELPREARAKASAEMCRVLKKDGLLVLTDSIQRGDRPSLDANIGNFEKMNEPYYVDYTEDNLPEHFMRGGLMPAKKIVRSTTKSLSFMKEKE